MKPVTFSVRVGSHDGIQNVIDLAVSAENAGFDQVWTGNDFLGEPGLVTLAAIAMKTKRIRFGSGVLDPVTLHPGQIAMFASGLQEISRDRFMVGIGAGSDVFFKRAGIHAANPVVRTREAVVGVRELTNGRSPAGAPGAAPGWTDLAVPRFSRPTPVYVGAMGPDMLRMAGRYADGALPLCLPPRHVFRVMDEIKRGVDRENRSLDDLDVAACVWASVADNRDDAKRAMAAHIALYSGSLPKAVLAENGFDPDEFQRTQTLLDAGHEEDAQASVTDSMLKLGIVGGTSDVIEQCAQLIDAGARHISFGPPMGPDPFKTLSMVGKKVLPALRALFKN